MILTKEDLQAIIDTMNPLIDARARTTETFIKAFVREEISASEKRMTIKIDRSITSAKKELREEILISRAEAKVDHLALSSKVDGIAKDHKRRLESLEEATNTPNPNKH